MLGAVLGVLIALALAFLAGIALGSLALAFLLQLAFAFSGGWRPSFRRSWLATFVVGLVGTLGWTGTVIVVQPEPNALLITCGMVLMFVLAGIVFGRMIHDGQATAIGVQRGWVLAAIILLILVASMGVLAPIATGIIVWID